MKSKNNAPTQASSLETLPVMHAISEAIAALHNAFTRESLLTRVASRLKPMRKSESTLSETAGLAFSKQAGKSVSACKSEYRSNK